MRLRPVCELVAATAVAVASTASSGQTCESLPTQLEDIREAYRPITQGMELPAAKDAVQQVRFELTSAATAALNCGCSPMYSELLNSAAFARLAEDSKTPQDFTNYVNRSILSYNTALDLFRNCR